MRLILHAFPNAQLESLMLPRWGRVAARPKPRWRCGSNALPTILAHVLLAFPEFGLARAEFPGRFLVLGKSWLHEPEARREFPAGWDQLGSRFPEFPEAYPKLLLTHPEFSLSQTEFRLPGKLVQTRFLFFPETQPELRKCFR